jgi:hypothetical protein
LEKEPEAHTDDDNDDFEASEYGGLRAGMEGFGGPGGEEEAVLVEQERPHEQNRGGDRAGSRGGDGKGTGGGGDAVHVEQERRNARGGIYVRDEGDYRGGFEGGEGDRWDGEGLPIFEPAENVHPNERLPDVLCQAALMTLERQSYLEDITATMDLSDLDWYFSTVINTYSSPLEKMVDIATPLASGRKTAIVLRVSDLKGLTYRYVFEPDSSFRF